MRLGLMAISAALLMAAGSTSAQEWVNVPIWGNGLLGQSALEHTRNATTGEYDGENESASSNRASNSPRACSPDALPAHERRAMEARFREIDRTQGREAAMAYVREQGRLFSERLVAEGVCTPDGRTAPPR